MGFIYLAADVLLHNLLLQHPLPKLSAWVRDYIRIRVMALRGSVSVWVRVWVRVKALSVHCFC